MSSSETDDFVFAADAIGFSLASNLYGTKIATQGFSDKKKGKFGREALALVSSAIECWKALEAKKPGSLQISKNSIPASLPELAIIVGGLDSNCVMPAMLQLALSDETMDTIRSEIDDAIGMNNSNSDARETAIRAQNRSKIGHKGSALMGKEKFRELAESLGDCWEGGAKSVLVGAGNSLGICH